MRPLSKFAHVRLSNAQDSLKFSVFYTVELFLPHIAVAYGFAPSFHDPRALSFALDQLFEPNFGPELSLEILNSMKAKLDLNGAFDRFTESTLTGIPLDPTTFEVFDIHNYLPEIQFALDLAPAVEFAAPSFRAADLFDALFPASIPTIKSFESFVKKKVMSKIRLALDGLFDAKVNVPTIGLSVDEVTFGVNGTSLGVYTEHNNRLFPPVIDIDTIQVSCVCVQSFNVILNSSI